MARRSEHSQEEIKAMVLSAAEMLVVEQGFSALTMRNVAAQIGYTVGSIYMVFDNMADLVLHINAQTLDQIVAQLKQTPAPSVEAFAKAYFDYAKCNFNRWCLIFDDHCSKDSAIPEWYQAKIDTVFSLFEVQFPGCDQPERKQMARILFAGLHGVCKLSLAGVLAGADDGQIENSAVLLARYFTQGRINSPLPDSCSYSSR